MSTQSSDYAQLCRQMREFQRNTLHFIHGSIKMLDTLLDNHESFCDDEDSVSDLPSLEELIGKAKAKKSTKASVRKSKDADTQTKPPRVRKPKTKAVATATITAVEEVVVEQPLPQEESAFSLEVSEIVRQMSENDDDMAELLG
jgi:hypothetical protein